MTLFCEKLPFTSLSGFQRFLFFIGPLLSRNDLFQNRFRKKLDNTLQDSHSSKNEMNRNHDFILWKAPFYIPIWFSAIFIFYWATSVQKWSFSKPFSQKTGQYSEKLSFNKLLEWVITPGSQPMCKTRSAHRNRRLAQAERSSAQLSSLRKNLTHIDVASFNPYGIGNETPNYGFSIGATAQMFYPVLPLIQCAEGCHSFKSVQSFDLMKICTSTIFQNTEHLLLYLTEISY